MLIIIFIVLFTNYFQINSLKCMQNENNIGHIFNKVADKFQKLQIDETKLFKATKAGCFIESDFNTALPDDNAINGKDNCELRTSTSDDDTTESCYAEIIFEYNTKSMIIYLNSIKDEDGGLFEALPGTGEKSMIQYEIKGDFDTNLVGLATRIQCNTEANCALNEARKILKKLSDPDHRLDLFKQIKRILYEPGSDPLKCLDSNDEDDKSCLVDVRFCKYIYHKDVGDSPEKGCKTNLVANIIDGFGFSSNLFIPSYEILYRYDEILKKPEDLDFKDKEHFSLIFLCKTNQCNSDATATKLDNLLKTFIHNPSNNPNAAIIDHKGQEKSANYKSPIGMGKGRKRNHATSLFSYSSIFIFIFLVFSRMFI